MIRTESGRRVASFLDVTHRPHKDATASPVSVAATGTSAGSSGPALLRGRSSGGRLRWLPFDWRLLAPFFLLGSAAGVYVLLWFLIVVAGQGS